MPPLIQYWHGQEPPEDIAELVDSFRILNPETCHLLFSRTTAEEFIARHFSKRELMTFRACAVPAMQADYFRHCAVYTLDGIYSCSPLHQKKDHAQHPTGNRSFGVCDLSLIN